MKYLIGVKIDASMYKKLSQALFFLLLIAVAIGGRIFVGLSISNGGAVYFDMFALVALTSLTSGYVSDKRVTYLVPLVIMSVSDGILYFMGIYGGIHTLTIALITLFVWTGFLMITFLGKIAGKKTEKSSFVLYAAAGIWGSLLYDAWTNFGFWLGPFYPHTSEGLILCYFMAIPFILGHLISTIVLLPPFYLLSKWGKENIFEEKTEEGLKTGTSPSTEANSSVNPWGGP